LATRAKRKAQAKCGKLRAEILMELARYAHPRLRATQDAPENPTAVVVQIKNYVLSADPVAKKLARD